LIECRAFVINSRALLSKCRALFDRVKGSFDYDGRTQFKGCEKALLMECRALLRKGRALCQKVGLFLIVRRAGDSKSAEKKRNA